MSGRFPLRQVLAAVPYLDALGVGALYLSPITAARAGSDHGYDVVDPTRLDPQIGDEEDLAALGAELARRGIGLLLDIVPNHMAASVANPWFADVLARGAASAHAGVFDIDWTWPVPHRILLPVLGEAYGAALARGDIRVVREDGVVKVAYFERRFPLAEPPAELPSDPGAVHALLERQPYRLAWWRTASERINYRRFFDVADLVGVRVEDPAVFDRVHALPIRLARAGLITGLRIDHVDGLWDPRGYLEQLQRALVGDEAFASGERFWIVVEKILSAEAEEELPDDWPVAGTTGYELGRAITAVLADAGGLARLDDLYHRFTGKPERFAALLVREKRRMLDELFAGELERRTSELRALAARDRDARDVSPRELGDALAEVSASLDVYRTYARAVPPSQIDRARVGDAAADARRRRPDLSGAIAFVARVLALELPRPAAAGEEEAWLAFVMRWQQMTGPAMAKGLEDTALYQYNRLLSLNMVGGEPDPPRRHLTADFFHAHARRQAARWPGSLLSTSTHDSKHGEDVRCRLLALSELPETWQRALWTWSRMNRARRAGSAPDDNEELFLYQTLIGAWPLDPDAEPAFRERLRLYLVKALREAKVHSSWHQPDEAYEQAVLDFADAILDEARAPAFVADLRRLIGRVALHGAVSSLAQLALKLASPGVADFYQGTELWSWTFVDPDNRAPIDLAARATLLTELERAAARDTAALCRDLCRTWRDGRIKLYVTWRGLAARRAHPDLFVRGEYLAAETTGAAREHLLGFVRRSGSQWLLCAVPRHAARLSSSIPLGGRVWRDTAVVLPAGAPNAWRDLLSGQKVAADGGLIPAGSLFRHLPVALLDGDG